MFPTEYPRLRDQGIELMSILMANRTNQPPTVADCKEWATTNTTTPVLFSPDGMNLLSAMAGGGPIGTPYAMLLDGNIKVIGKGAGGLGAVQGNIQSVVSNPFSN